MPENLPDNSADVEAVRYEEEVQMEPAVRGSVAMVAGKILLWMDLILLSWVYMSVRFWVWWFLSQGALGVILVGVGASYRRHRVR